MLLVRFTDFTNKGEIEDPQFKYYVNTKGSGMPGAYVEQIVIGKNHDVWVATGAGLGRFTPALDAGGDVVWNENGTWESDAFKSGKVEAEGGLLTDWLKSLAYDHATDTLWIGTSGGGVTRLRVSLFDQ